MDWTQVLAIIGANIAFGLTMFLWLRGESNNDRREIMSLLKGIQDEMKDFHGRLVAIEERRVKILEK